MKKIMIAVIMGCSMTAFAQKNITVDTQKSVVNWLGTKLMGFNNHYGTVLFKEGTFIKTKDKITGGTFVIDMNTIANIDGGYHDGLVKHLKDDDFFAVAQYPTATLVMTQVIYSDTTHLDITADLTIKGITLPVNFNAEVDYAREEMIANLVIDRTRWNIMHGSAGLVDIKDHIIDHNIELKVELKI